MQLSSGIKLETPYVIKSKDIRLDFNKLAKALGKIVVDITVQNWPGAIKGGFDILDGFSVHDSVGATAWKLIQRALLLSISNLIREKTIYMREQGQQIEEAIKKIINDRKPLEISIDNKFIKYPAASPLLYKLRQILSDALIETGIERPVALAVSDSLPTYFIYSFHECCKRYQKEFDRVRQGLNEGVSELVQREDSWLRYGAFLQKRINEPIFGEPYGLSQLYIPLRAYYERKHGELFGGGNSKDEQRQIEYNIVMLEDEINQWLSAANRDDAIRVISGGPGSGKSTTVKILAGKLAENMEGRKVIYLPLHLIDPTKRLIESLTEYAEFDEYLPDKPIIPQSGEKYLLILDGLDELAMQGKAAEVIVKDFVTQFTHEVELFNTNEAKLLILACGRDLAVQSAESWFEKVGRVLHILPYLVIDFPKNEGVSKPEALIKNSEQLDLLRKDQRWAWWEKYYELTGCYNNIVLSQVRFEFDNKRLLEITAQPLLNYLLALIRTANPTDYQTNLNSIYFSLLKRVWERDYSESKVPMSTLRELTLDEFSLVLQDIALAMWHGNGRTATLKEIKYQCAGLDTILNRLTRGNNDGMTGLLMAFYFRRSERTPVGQDTFEFTHKSFGEYLTARRIVQAVDCIVDEMSRKRPGYSSGWGQVDALAHWLTITGPTLIDKYILEFIHDEIRLLPVKAESYQNTLVELLNYILKYGMPVESMRPRPSYYSEEEVYSLNACTALIAVLCICSQVTGRHSDLTSNPPRAFGTLIYKLQGQRESAINHIILNCLAGFKLPGNKLLLHDLYAANLTNAYLAGVDFSSANLQNAFLAGANLDSSLLRGANLAGASLNGASMKGAHLSLAIASRINIEGADLSSAQLKAAMFTRAVLTKANLSNADLRMAVLSETECVSTYFKGADCRQTDFRASNLRKADFSNADLRQADFRKANLQKAILRDADLRGADLREANLRGADLVRSKYDQAILGDTSFEYAILEE